MKIKETKIAYIILAVIFLIMILPWLKQGIPVTDDYRHHFSRFWILNEQAGNFNFSEWIPNMYGGWPQFHFYHPMFYVLNIPTILLLNPGDALKLATFLAYIISLLGTFFAGKTLFKNNRIALFGAIAYTLSSHFLFHATVSGALPRLTAIALVPITSALFIKALENKDGKSVAISGIFSAVLFMMHTSVAIPTFIVFAIYAVLNTLQEKSSRSIISGAIVALIILGISAAWVVPLIFEKEYASLPSQNSLESPYIEQTSRTFGIVNENGKFVRSNFFGYSIMALSIIGLFLLKNNRTTYIIKGGLIASVLLYFNFSGLLKFMPFFSTAISGSTTFFIAILVFNAVFLAAAVAEALSVSFKKSYILHLLLVVVIIELYPGISAFSYSWNQAPASDIYNPSAITDAWNFVKELPGNFMVFSSIGICAEAFHEKQEFGFDWVGCPQCVGEKTYKLHNEIWNNFTQGMKDDSLLGYLGVKYYVAPCSFNLNNKLAYSNGAVCVYENEKFTSLIESNAGITDVVFENGLISFTSSSNSKEKATIKANYFKPHWHAYIDGKETEISGAWPEYMAISIPEGEHSIELKYKTNILHIVSWCITFLTAILIFYFMKKDRK
ncbi:YfhO family protein [Candidatus Woesearchaeota archaeon]|nr:YfhO family protein [Candidatus Woesearchaeota archaeon]